MDWGFTILGTTMYDLGFFLKHSQPGWRLSHAKVNRKVGHGNGTDAEGKKIPNRKF